MRMVQARTGLSFLGAGTALFTAYHKHSSVEQRDIAPACGLLIANGSFLLLFATRRYVMVCSCTLSCKVTAATTFGSLVCRGLELQ
jgi:hypothetical protein